MNQRSGCILVLFIFVSLIGWTSSRELEFTVDVADGARECFFESLKKHKGKDNTVSVEYQVEDGGDMLIDASLHTPGGDVIFTHYRSSGNSHRFEPHEDGDYQLCFDNGVSYQSKMVFFVVFGDSKDSEDDDDDDNDDENYFKRIASPDAKEIEEYDGKVNDFKYRFQRIHSSIESIGRLQSTIRSVESKDRHLAERNYEKVNFWSMVNLSVMVFVLVLQVFLIKSLFEEKSLLNRQLNKLSTLTN